MSQPVNDADYTDDKTEVNEDLPPETDPATIPADEGDKGSA